MGLLSHPVNQGIRNVLIPENSCKYTCQDRETELQPAAVLIPLLETENGTSVLLTKRTKHLHHHPGQVSLPGGMMDEQDRTPVETALRETHEEVGIESRFIEIMGGLDDYPTNTGFLISPIVGRVLSGFTLDPDPFEVEEIFTVPLSFIFDEKNHQRYSYVSRELPGPQRTGYYYQMDYGNKRIWGVTAAILVNFYKRLKDNHPLFCELVPQIDSQ